MSFLGPMCQTWLQLLALLGGFGGPGLLQVAGMEIFTSSEMEAVNGTNVKLKCTFSSRSPVQAQSVTVSWNFRPLNQGAEESVFYYHETPYPPMSGRFKDHAVWSGDIMRNDASITLRDVPPTFNGTYICQVRNKPDVHGKNGEIFLKVVNKISLSEMGMLALAVGGACGIILLILGIVVLVKFCRRRHSETEIEMHEQEWKDPTVCKPEEALHLNAVEKVIEVDSSDGESEASSGGDEEEEEGEEDDDGGDDEDGGDEDDD